LKKRLLEKQHATFSLIAALTSDTDRQLMALFCVRHLSESLIVLATEAYDCLLDNEIQGVPNAFNHPCNDYYIMRCMLKNAFV